MEDHLGQKTTLVIGDCWQETALNRRQPLILLNKVSPSPGSTNYNKHKFCAQVANLYGFWYFLKYDEKKLKIFRVKQSRTKLYKFFT